jgi:hypothetical protein
MIDFTFALVSLISQQHGPFRSSYEHERLTFQRSGRKNLSSYELS